MTESKSLAIARQFLGEEVVVTIDRPLGSTHPKYGFIYQVNYGYLEGVKAPDGEDLDAYVLGVAEPVPKASGVVRAIMHRINDDDDKLVVLPSNVEMSDEEIEKMIAFQEQWFKHKIVRG